ncbi:hypothetical protein P0R31_37005 [Bradyrhizobium yuanmingense]|uniref:hypothetical protein n=1 Tax=Bradyrhizobium yuanmingense TaxID=108015 RepID=UPI0023B8E9C2|nr:hypothetical protein [Bradyrhizobium yuanmingense]MDF0522838.1 hypothetical protein [Bradyrhizobium yuanmingense]
MPRRSAASMAGSVPRGFSGVEAVIDEIEDEWRRAKRGGRERLLDFQCSYAGRFVEKHALRFWLRVRALEWPAPAALSLASRLYNVHVQWDTALHKHTGGRAGYPWAVRRSWQPPDLGL